MTSPGPTAIARDGRVQSSLISFLHDGADVFFHSRPDTPTLRDAPGAQEPGVP